MIVVARGYPTGLAGIARSLLPGGPRHGPPDPPALGASRRSRDAPRACARGGVPKWPQLAAGALLERGTRAGHDSPAAAQSPPAGRARRDDNPGTSEPPRFASVLSRKSLEQYIQFGRSPGTREERRWAFVVAADHCRNWLDRRGTRDAGALGTPPDEGASAGHCARAWCWRSADGAQDTWWWPVRVGREAGQTVGNAGARGFVGSRLDGLLDEPHPRAPRRITDADVERGSEADLEREAARMRRSGVPDR